MFTRSAKRIRNGLLKRLKTVRKVYTSAAFLELKFTHEVRKHAKKFTSLPKKFTHEVRKPRKSLHTFSKNSKKVCHEQTCVNQCKLRPKFTQICPPMRASLLQVHTIDRNRALNMLSDGATPFCSSCPKSWRSGSPTAWLMSWTCHQRQGVVTTGVLRTSTVFFCSALSLTDRAITCTHLTVSSLNLTCIAELCSLYATLSIWRTTAFMAKILRYFIIFV